MTGHSPDLAALLEEIAESEDERALFGRVFDHLALAAEVAAPPPSLKTSVLQRIADDGRAAQFEEDGNFFARSAGLAWTEIAPGVELQFMYVDPATGGRVLLVRMGPNLLFPTHDHHVIEDLYLVSGQAYVGDIPMRAGDYCRAPAGTTHSTVRSGPEGALSFVVQR